MTVESGFHHAVAIACMEAGLHVLCEKLMARTISDCKAMIAKAKEKGVKVPLSYQTVGGGGTWRGRVRRVHPIDSIDATISASTGRDSQTTPNPAARAACARSPGATCWRSIAKLGSRRAR